MPPFKLRITWLSWATVGCSHYSNRCSDMVLDHQTSDEVRRDRLVFGQPHVPALLHEPVKFVVIQARAPIMLLPPIPLNTLHPCLLLRGSGNRHWGSITSGYLSAHAIHDST